MRKNIKYSILSLLAIMGMASCSNDYEYTPAEAVSNAQVFFADKTIAVTSYDLDMNATSFDVEVQRVKTDGELTVALENHQNPASTLQLSVPESVTFADGESKATITVGYKYEEGVVEFDDVNRDTIVIADADYTTQYGGTEYRFAASIPAPWTPWVGTASEFKAAGGVGEYPLGSEGTGTYTHVIMGNDDVEGLTVTMRQNKMNPDEVQFKVFEWGKDWFSDNGVELVMNGVWDEENQIYRIDVPFTFTGYNHSTYGAVYTADVVTYGAWRTANGATGWDVTWEEAPSYYTPATGKFTLHMVDFVSAGSFGNDYEFLQMDGFYVPDYSVAARFAGILKTPAEENQAVVDFTLAVDVANAKYALTGADQSESAVAQAILAGELEAAEISESGRVYLPLEEDGKYRVTIVSFDAEGEAQESASAVFEFAAGGSEWESLGMGQYTDDLMGGVYGVDPVTYEVEVLASTKTPGLYRMKNAYGESYPYHEQPGDWDDSMDYYLELDATNPDAVTFAAQELGFDWGNGMASAVAVQTGTLVDGVITFPARAFYIALADVNGGNWGWYGNTNGAFKLVLPGAAAVKPFKAPAKKHARRVLKPAKKLVIKKMNEKVSIKALQLK